MDRVLEMHIREQVIPAFDFGGEVLEVERYGGGHINDTFRVHTAAKEDMYFLLQRISTEAFKRPDLLMENIARVTEYLGEKIRKAGGDRGREALDLILTRGGALYHTDDKGGVWRVFRFIGDSCCYEAAVSVELFASVGRAFGRFQKMMDGYPAETLHETIPRFHDTPNRLENLKKAVAEDKLGRAVLCQEEIAFAMERQADCSAAMDALKAGTLPLRVTHNDTKLNNVLFDAKSGEVLCVVDLDTVMPGLSINDFGDSIRSGANRCAEDEPDLSKVYLDLELYQAYTEAFLEGAEDTLTEGEIEYLPWGAKLMTLECGIRFLTDYLEGDHYFHTSREGQNLDRCRVQFRLVADMEKRWEDMHTVIREIRG